MRCLALLAPLLLLAACATLSEEECRGGDWRAIGREDGAAGRSADFIAEHAKACADYAIAPDRRAWEAGRQDGLKYYCTPGQAYRDGTRGRHLRPVCPEDSLAALEAANRRGLTVWHIRREIDDIQREIREVSAELAALPPGDPARAALASERSFLRLDLLRLRARLARYP